MIQSLRMREAPDDPATRIAPIEVSPREPLIAVIRRLDRACRERGIELCGFEKLNTALPISGFANFFQAWIDGVETIIVIMTEEWSKVVVTDEWTGMASDVILQLLLEIRAEPDPPGSRQRFEFYAAYPPPPILTTLFGAYRISPLECRAANVVKFGRDLRAESCTRLAAVGVKLLSSLDASVDFYDPRGIDVLSRSILEEVHALRIPVEGAPINLLICLGCLYGELLRSRLPYPTDWAMVKEYYPWPGLVVWSRKPGDGAPSRSLGFNPIALVMFMSQEGGADFLEKSAAALLERCRAEFVHPR
jgi:hypothetical protein